MFAVHRLEKYGRSAVHGINMERNREKFPEHNFARSDIDQTLTQQNISLIDCPNFNAEISRQLKSHNIKERDDSIVMIGALYTASREFFTLNPEYRELSKEERALIRSGDMIDSRTPEQRIKWIPDEKTMQFFRDCLEFHIQEYCAGDRSRVLSAKIDFDETTPHLQIYSVPLQERINKKGIAKMHLSAKNVIGGRGDLRRHQDYFYEAVGKSRGLQRGDKVDWDLPPEERQKHKDSYEYRKEQQQAHIKAQEAVIAHNEERIQQQEQEAQRGSERLSMVSQSIDEQTQKQEALKAENDSLRAENERVVNTIDKNTKLLDATNEALMQQKRGRRKMLDSEVVYGLTAQEQQAQKSFHAEAMKIAESPVYVPHDVIALQDEVRRKDSEIWKLKRELMEKNNNIERLARERSEGMVRDLNSHCNQLERKLSRSEKNEDYLMRVIETIAQEAGYALSAVWDRFFPHMERDDHKQTQKPV